MGSGSQVWKGHSSNIPKGNLARRISTKFQKSLTSKRTSITPSTHLGIWRKKTLAVAHPRIEKISNLHWSQESITNSRTKSSDLPPKLLAKNLSTGSPRRTMTTTQTKFLRKKTSNIFLADRNGKISGEKPMILLAMTRPELKWKIIIFKGKAERVSRAAPLMEASKPIKRVLAQISLKEIQKKGTLVQLVCPMAGPRRAPVKILIPTKSPMAMPGNFGTTSESHRCQPPGINSVLEGPRRGADLTMMIRRLWLVTAPNH